MIVCTIVGAPLRPLVVTNIYNDPVFKPVVEPQVKFLQKKFSVLNLTVWVQEQFENFVNVATV
jgi:hypothetical protein